MKKYLLTLTFLLCSTIVLAADLKLPDTVSGATSDFISVTATTTCPVVKWYVVDPGLNLFPPSLLKDTKTAVVTSGVAGKYRLLAYTGDANGLSEPTITTVFVGVSPTPPGPPIPVPTDGFFTALQAAYTADMDTNKAQYRDDYANLFKMFNVNDPSLTTVGGLLVRFQSVDQELLKKVFTAERAVVTPELGAALKYAVNTPLDQPTRDAISKEFAKISQYVSLLK